MRKLFLLEDDLSLISGLTFAFKKQGFALDTARTLAEAEVLWSDRKYDLLVLDVSLPDGSCSFRSVRVYRPEQNEAENGIRYPIVGCQNAGLYRM